MLLVGARADVISRKQLRLLVSTERRLLFMANLLIRTTTCAICTTRGRFLYRGASLLRPSCRCMCTFDCCSVFVDVGGARAGFVSAKQPEVVSKHGKQPEVVSTNDFRFCHAGFVQR